MHYNLIFDIVQTQFQHWSDLLGAFVFLVAGIGFFLFHWRGAKRTGWLSFGYSVFIALFLSLFSLFPFFMFFRNYQNYLDIKQAMKQSQCVIAEGVVTQFSHPRPGKSGATVEAFDVRGIQFRYVDGSNQNGFHQIGIIHDGMQVRIYHYDKSNPVYKDIARLEIAE